MAKQVPKTTKNTVKPTQKAGKTTKEKQDVLTVTESAAKKIKELAKGDKKDGYGLKVFVFPGGCSGFQYGMDFEEKASKEDMEFTQHGLKVFLLKDCVDMIKGSKIDYISTSEMTGFKIDNPNTMGGGCGCSSGEKKEGGGCCSDEDSGGSCGCGSKKGGCC